MLRSRTPGAVAVLTGLVLAGAVGCSSGGVRIGPDADKREHRVAADRHASAAEIVTAGRPADVASARGMSLVTYHAESEDDEGPQQGAWRLYDADGRRVSDGRLGQVREQSSHASALSLPDGFLVEGYRTPSLLYVSADGRATRIGEPTRRATTRPGDVEVEHGLERGPAFYRPADHAAYRLPRIPYRDAQSVAIADDGTVWVMLPWTRARVRLAYAAGGSAPWHRMDVPVPPGTHPAGLDTGMAVEHGRVVLTLASGPDEGGRLRGFEVLGTDAGAGWRRVGPDGIGREYPSETTVQVLPDGRLLVGAPRRGGWLQDAAGGFTRLDLPDSGTSEPDLSVVAAGDRLYAVPELGRRLWVSTDLGKSWHRFRP